MERGTLREDIPTLLKNSVTGAHCALGMIHSAAGFNRSLDFRIDLLFITSAGRLVARRPALDEIADRMRDLQVGMGRTVSKTNSGLVLESRPSNYRP